MKKPFLIVYNTIEANAELVLIEYIRENYVSKKTYTNCYCILAESESAKQIFDKIESSIPKNSGYLIIELDKFFGRFYDDFVPWIKEKLPDYKFV